MFEHISCEFCTILYYLKPPVHRLGINMGKIDVLVLKKNVHKPGHLQYTI